MNMDAGEAQRFVEDLYLHLLKRSPGPKELADWTSVTAARLEPQAVFRKFVESDEYAGKRSVATAFPAGHYHSPIVDPASVSDYYARSRALKVDDLAGIDLNVQDMLSFWDAHLGFIRTTPFTEKPQEQLRFHYAGSPYPWGDAILLRAMIASHRPRRIIEIGSGFSTACMLDSADQCGHAGMSLICIEPYPDRLHSLLRPGDYARVKVIPLQVQEVSVEVFDELQADDILFIDSTHVLKTGSDVHYELFSILPRLRKGVLIHFHDCPFPFEYPQKWVVELNYSWNEAYALRAFLMYNARFTISFWNSLFAAVFRARIANDYPEFLRNAGSSIWLTVR